MITFTNTFPQISLIRLRLQLLQKVQLYDSLYNCNWRPGTNDRKRLQVDHQYYHYLLRVSIPPLLTGPQVLYTPGLLPAQIHTNARRWLSVQRGASEYQNLPRERT